jgi:hypothetical protein
MQKPLRINGEKKQYDPEKTVKELKKDIGAENSHTLFYNDGTGEHPLSEKDKLRHIPDRANITKNPVGDGLTG